MNVHTGIMHPLFQFRPETTQSNVLRNCSQISSTPSCCLNRVANFISWPGSSAFQALVSARGNPSAELNCSLEVLGTGIFLPLQFLPVELLMAAEAAARKRRNQNRCVISSPHSWIETAPLGSGGWRQQRNRGPESGRFWKRGKSRMEALLSKKVNSLSFLTSIPYNTRAH